MEVKDLLDEINNGIKEYGDDFLKWEVYTEQINEYDKQIKRGEVKPELSNGILDQSSWGKIKDGEGWEYFECCGFWTKFSKEKIFTINVNF